MITYAILINVGVFHGFSAESRGELKRLHNGAAIVLTPAKVVHFRAARCLDEGVDESGHVLGMDVVADLFSLVPEHPVLTLLQIAPGQVAQEPVEFDPGVIGAGQTSSAQATKTVVVN